MPSIHTTTLPNTLKQRILRQLYFEKVLSSSALSEQVKKSIPLVSKALAELVKEGFIVDNGYAPSSGGRRPLMYSLQPDHGFIVAVAMDQLFTRIAVMNLHNSYLSEPETIAFDLHQSTHGSRQLAEMINAHISRSGVNKDKIIGVGIGMPGFINIEKGVNHTFLNDQPGNTLREYLESKVGLPVYVDNDSSLIALAEWRFGLAKAAKNVMVINIGWGIGLGMIVNGQLFRGHAGYAGEFSHIPISENDIICECGKRGCLETETSLLVVTQKAAQEAKKGKIAYLKPFSKNNDKRMGDAIMEAANKGDQFAIGLLSDMAYKLGKGIAILIHIMNPEMVVLSGRGAKAGKTLVAPIQQALNQYCIPRLVENTELKVSRLGYNAGLIGAAALVMENFGTRSRKASVTA